MRAPQSVNSPTCDNLVKRDHTLVRWRCLLESTDTLGCRTHVVPTMLFYKFSEIAHVVMSCYYFWKLLVSYLCPCFLGCLCQYSVEIVDHLLIHCMVAHYLWSFVFRCFGIYLVKSGRWRMSFLVGGIGCVSICQLLGTWFLWVWCGLLGGNIINIHFEDVELVVSNFL